MADDELRGPGGMALASWTLLHVLIRHLMDAGMLNDADRGALVERALRIIERQDPTGDGSETLRHARQVLEEFL